MRHILIAVCVWTATSSAFAGNPSVSVTIGQPGFYGRIDIGNYPPPVLVYSQPVVIAPAPVSVVQQPLYLRVPTGQAKKWAKHCAKYNACGQPVYFVQETWYQNVYVPSYKQRGGYERGDTDDEQGDRKGEGKHKNKQKDKHKGNDQG